ncbi:putative glycoside hydrolase [Undibacterium arcticum]|uniref:Glycoside hydrolase n=1 Tax=Undibacterium arcticum TaxID=1762892 RepID=A0ABV7F5Z6_9BURK
MEKLPRRQDEFPGGLFMELLPHDFKLLGSRFGATCRALPLVMAVMLSAWHGLVLADHGFPRLMGSNIGEKHYDDPIYQMQLARMDIVILGFYRGWGHSQSQQPIRDVVRTLKRVNPNLLVAQYTILNEANDDSQNSAENDKQSKLRNEGWWLRRGDGRRVQWTNQYQAWDINITEWTKPDSSGQRYPEWLAQRDYHVFFEPVPEFDIWYFDNVMAHQRIALADWRRDGKDEAGDSPEIQKAFRRGQAAHWKKAHELAPKALLMGNADNDLSLPEYKGKLQAVFLEGLMGKSWSLYANGGWGRMMDLYHKVFDNLLSPRIVGFNVAGRPSDYRFLRFALASCLMNNGYFSYTDETRGYSTVPWFDEYEVKLGKPLDPPQTKPWRDGIYRRRFENGLVLVNLGFQPGSIDVEPGYTHFRGKQAPQVNNGLPAKSILLGPGDGVLLVKVRSLEAINR